uniref:Ependymin-like 1 n=1 Tax=Cyprinus carpio TaxID=7962 RepID=A0A8C1YN46_CYPCA
GSMSVFQSAQDGQVWAVAKYHYDALLDLLFLFRKGVVYTIDDRNRTCQKNPLKVPFHPLHIPHNASLQSQVVLGGSSACNEGLLVNTWTGDVPEIGGECHMDYSDDAVYGTVSSLPVFIQNILNCVLKTNKAFTGLE